MLNKRFINKIRPYFAMVEFRTESEEQSLELYLDENRNIVKFQENGKDCEIPVNLNEFQINSVYLGLDKAGAFIWYACYQEVFLPYVRSNKFLEDFNRPADESEI